MAHPHAVARRRMRRGAKLLGLGGIALILAGLYLSPGPPVPSFAGGGRAAGSGGGGGPPGSSTLNLSVNLTDRPGFDPAYLTVPVQTPINLTVRNVGNLSHSFTLLNRPNFVLNRSLSPEQVDAYFHTNGSQANLTVAPGGLASVNLSFAGTQAGFSFEFVSQVPYQFQAGMLGFLNVSGPPSGPGQVANVSADATSLAFFPNVLEVNATQFPVTIDLAITNLGSNYHTLWLSAQPNYTINPGNFSAYFLQHPPLVSKDLPRQPGQVVWANFTVAKPGVYEFVCTVPGHLLAGMNGSIYVGVPAPAPSVPPSTAIVAEWVLWGGAGILGIGGLLAGAALLVGRFPRGPPPRSHG